jgi:thiamine-monophosphate kinase
MNEFELIRRLTQGLPSNGTVWVGPGDDCAVLDLGLPDRWVLFKTDAVVEGVHFEAEVAPERIGHKALARCLSDVAAMGGDPGSVLITLGLPPGFDAGRIEGVYRGIRGVAERYGVAVVGGETTTNPGGLLISVALMGTVGKDRCVLRRGAMAGDALFVSGTLGGSIEGRHLDFEPRVEEGRWLAQEFRVHAMIDVSDGLAGDLRHVLAASGVGAELLGRAIPVSAAARAAARKVGVGKTALVAALTDGEDFELLFAVAAGDAVRVLDGWRARFPEVRLSCIGRVTGERGLRLRTADGMVEFKGNGYVHFA